MSDEAHECRPFRECVLIHNLQQEIGMMLNDGFVDYERLLVTSATS